MKLFFFSVDISDFNKDSINKVDLRNSTFSIEGNLRDEVNTTPIFYESILQFNNYVNKLSNKDIKIFNLNDGAKLDSTISIECSNIILKKEINKNKNFYKNIITQLDKFSKIGITKKIEAQKIYENLDNAKYMINYINKFVKIEHFEYKKFSTELISFIEFCISKKSTFGLHQIYYEYLLLVMPHIFLFFNNKDIQESKIHINKIKEILCKQLIKIAQEYLKDYKELEKLINIK